MASEGFTKSVLFGRIWHGLNPGEGFDRRRSDSCEVTKRHCMLLVNLSSC